jgi:hypothetical protein
MRVHTKTAKPGAGTAAITFQQGQLWKVGAETVAVTSVGKTLVHYKIYKTQTRGIMVRLTSKLDLEKFLVSRKATPVAE